MSSARIGVRDWLTGVAVAAILLITGLSAERAATGVDPVGVVLLVAGGLALAARRRAPVVVLVVTGACAIGYQAAGFPVFAVAYLVAVYAAVRAGHRRATVLMSVVMLVVLPGAAMIAGPLDIRQAFDSSRGVLELAWLIAAGAAGEALRQAERRADEAERTREETALRRADEERLHIARELHDCLTHQISVIKVQAEAAVHLAQKQGEQVPESLLVIRDAGRAASRELRATLEALRDEGTTAGYGLDQVAELVLQARTTTLDTSLTIEGARTVLPEAVDRTAYRIVQEALTNIGRHAAAATACVRVEYRTDVVVVRVDDDGSAVPQFASGTGVGLVGMRERVAALGGRLHAGARSEGGFTVYAELPVPGAS
ncbi:histidine kinase [Micromonospora sp. NPDC047793]|uniref:sensor histidine kinase n=1 Tax=unclassified Micromonospora TaxID=2617518 RepID=UPI00340D170E